MISPIEFFSQTQSPIKGDFVLDQPNIQTFERKPKEPKPEATTA